MTTYSPKMQAMISETHKRIAKIDALFAKIDAAVAIGDEATAIKSFEGIEAQLLTVKDAVVAPKVKKEISVNSSHIRSQIKSFTA